MNSTTTTFEADLVHQMQEEVNNGTIQLSAEEWAELNRDLEEASRLLERDEVNERLLESAAWLVITAFEENETLGEHFDDKLTSLTAGTKLTGKILCKMRLNPKTEECLLKNKMIMLSFMRWLGRRMPGNKSSDEQS